MFENKINLPKPRIRSTLIGRLELEHIQEKMKESGAKPDFGYDIA